MRKLFGKAERTINRILIVEDEPLVAFDNEHFLRDAGFTIVATLDTAAEAMRALDAHAVDLLLVDIRLSDGDHGIAVGKAARAKGAAVLVVSGDCPDEARSFAAGCLAKPFSQRDLRGAIDAIEARLAGREIRHPPKALSLFG
jgi:DNA-binding response OmpR family regulator